MEIIAGLNWKALAKSMKGKSDMLSNQLLQGERIYLDTFNVNDLMTLTLWFEDSDFLRNLDATPAMPRVQGQIEEWVQEKQKSQIGYLFAIRVIESNKLIGYIELDSILWNQQVGWVATAIGENQQRNKGYGQDALNTLIRFAFHELNLRRLQLTVFSYNHTAIHVYETVGFVREGTYREFLHRDGKLYDMYLYGLLRREWEQKKK